MNIDKIIAGALEEEFEERIKQCSDDTEKIRFSLSYRLWEYKALRNLRKNRYNSRWTLRRAKYAVTAMIAAVSLLIGTTVYAAVALGRYSFEAKQEYSKLFIDKLSSDKTSFEEYYGLPEENGWELTNYDIMKYSTMLKYKCGEKSVDFSQSIIQEGNMGNINTEKAEIEPISLFTENDGFILVFSDDLCAVYWLYDGYLLDLSGNITKDEAINLAHSTKIINF